MRVPHRDDPRDPWTADEVTELYRLISAEAPWPEVDDTKPQPSRLLGPDGRPLPPPDPIPFGFRRP